MAKWKAAKPGTLAHAVMVTNRKKTLCNLKVGGDWLTVVKSIPKCERCKAMLRTKGQR